MKIMAHKPGLKPSLRYANRVEKLIDYCIIGYISSMLTLGTVIIGDCIADSFSKNGERPEQAVVNYDSGLESRIEK